MDRTTTLDELKQQVAQFVAAREWEKFHTPKNLSMGLAIEAAELMELFQWYSGSDSIWVAQARRTKQAAAEELADCVIYCLSFATATGIDIAAAVRAKLRRNQRKYPVRKFRGRY